MSLWRVAGMPLSMQVRMCLDLDSNLWLLDSMDTFVFLVQPGKSRRRPGSGSRCMGGINYIMLSVVEMGVCVLAVAGALVACAAPKSCCMAVVPRGLGPHDFATFLNLPLNATEALDIATNADCEPIDIGLLNKSQVLLLLYSSSVQCHGYVAGDVKDSDSPSSDPEVLAGVSQHGCRWFCCRA